MSTTKQPRQRAHKTELFAFRIEAPMRPAMTAAAAKLHISTTELIRRAILREVERLGCLPT